MCVYGLGLGAVGLCVLNGYGKREKFHQKIQDVNWQFKVVICSKYKSLNKITKI